MPGSLHLRLGRHMSVYVILLPLLLSLPKQHEGSHPPSLTLAPAPRTTNRRSFPSLLIASQHCENPRGIMETQYTLAAGRSFLSFAYYVKTREPVTSFSPGIDTGSAESFTLASFSGSLSLTVSSAEFFFSECMLGLCCGESRDLPAPRFSLRVGGEQLSLSQCLLFFLS